MRVQTATLEHKDGLRVVTRGASSATLAAHGDSRALVGLEGTPLEGSVSLAAQNVRCVLGGVVAVDDVSLRVEQAAALPW